MLCNKEVKNKQTNKRTKQNKNGLDFGFDQRHTEPGQASSQNMNINEVKSLITTLQVPSSFFQAAQIMLPETDLSLLFDLLGPVYKLFQDIRSHFAQA